jgi:hypothetical protein
MAYKKYFRQSIVFIFHLNNICKCFGDMQERKRCMADKKSIR